jgi:hypothetical protein
VLQVVVAMAVAVAGILLSVVSGRAESLSTPQELQVGAHLTGFHVSASEWSAAGGWAMDSDRRRGPYMRLGVSVKY